MNNELIKKMKKIAKAMNVMYGDTLQDCYRYKLVDLDTQIDIETLTRDEHLKNVYLWALRRSGTALMKLCKDNIDNIQEVIETQSYVAFFRIENGQITPITHLGAMRMTKTI